ncbi:MAG: VCBS repeat-containing protein, partial [Deltaproteobacteria bacterium]|nr:VCBS repeat-containing protein [Deltaproteobacteria bacterium]
SYNMLAYDVTGDGDADLVGADFLTNHVHVLVSNGDGTFQAATTINTLSAGHAASIGDFNGDSVMDIVAAVSGSDVLQIAFGNGNGTFKAAISYQAVNLPNDVTVGDMNGDGYADLVSVSYDSATPVVEVFLGNGDGAFKARVSSALLQSGVEVELLDVNADGKLDVIAQTKAPGNTVTSFVELLLGNGDGTFNAPSSYQSGPRPTTPMTGISLEDMNGDGVKDLLSISVNPHVLPFTGSTTTRTTGVYDLGKGQAGQGDPLKTRVTSRGNASVSLYSLKELKKFIEKDLKGITAVLEELQSARNLSGVGARAFEDAALSRLTAQNADILAGQIIAKLQSQLRDNALRAHGKLDRKLLEELLSDS